MARLWQESKLLAKHSSIYAVGTMMQRVAGFLLLPLYTKFLSPADYGSKELVALTTEVLSVLLGTAISTATYRFYFKYNAESNRRLVISTSILTIAAAGALVIPAVMLAAPFLGRVLLDDPGTALYFRLALGALFFQLLNRVGYDYLRANQQSIRFVSLSFARLVIAIGLNVWLIVGRDMGITGIFISTLVTSVLMFFVLTGPLLVRVGPRFSRSLLIKLLKFGGPLVPAQLGTFVVMVSDRFLLKTFGSLAETGLYSLAMRFGTLPSTFISQPFNQTWLPRRFEIAKEPGAEKVFGRIFSYFLVLITFAGLGVALLSRDLIALMADPAFYRAADVVPIIVLANVIFTLYYHLMLGLMLSDKTKFVAMVNLMNAVLVVSLNLFLIPRFGAFGAASSLVVAYSLRNIVVHLLARRYYAIHFEFGRVIKIAVAAAITYVAGTMVPAPNIWLGMAFRVLMTVAFPLLLIAMRFFSPDELARAKELFTRKVMRRR